MKKIPILIDCDTGIDDAIALTAALYSDEADLKAITTVDGNVSLKYTSKNTLNLVRHLGFDTKVAVGADRALIGNKFRDASDVHGKNGMGTVELPECGLPFYEKSAVDTIYETAKACCGELVLVPIGPMTNIALALITYPDLKNYIKRIVFMGGAVRGGNASNSAEFNAWIDPEACSIVLNSGIPCTMVGLDVTNTTTLCRDDIEYIRSIGTVAGDFAAEMLEFMATHRTKSGEPAAAQHDALALAAALVPEIMEFREYYVDCECRGMYTRGHTAVDLRHEWGKDPNCSVAVAVNVEEFRSWIRKTISNSASPCINDIGR